MSMGGQPTLQSHGDGDGIEDEEIEFIHEPQLDSEGYEGPVNAAVDVDIDMFFWTMVCKWKQRAKWGDNELQELLHFLFNCNHDVKDMSIRSLSQFKKYTKGMLQRRGNGNWIDATFPSPSGSGMVDFRYRAGEDGLRELYRNEKNVGSGFEWRYVRMPQDESLPRIYSTPSTSEWWRLAEVSDEPVWAEG